MESLAGVLIVGCCHISHDNELFSTLSIYSTLVSFCIKDHIMMLFYAFVDFYLFYDGAVDMQI